MNVSGISIDTVWNHLVVGCLTRGHLIRGTRELTGCHIVLKDPSLNCLGTPTRKFKIGYAAAELAWYLSGQSDISRLCLWAPQYKQFSDDGWAAYGAYGPRGLSFPSLLRVAGELYNNPMSRQHVIPIWRPRDRSADSKDIPCTTCLHFLHTREGLELHVHMRSNDLWLGFPNDVFCFTEIQKFVAKVAGHKVGPYHHYVSSMHLYERDWGRFHDGLKEGQSSSIPSMGKDDAPQLVAYFLRDLQPVEAGAYFRTVFPFMENQRHDRN